MKKKRKVRVGAGRERVMDGRVMESTECHTSRTKISATLKKKVNVTKWNFKKFMVKIY